MLKLLASSMLSNDFSDVSFSASVQILVFCSKFFFKSINFFLSPSIKRPLNDLLNIRL